MLDGLALGALRLRDVFAQRPERFKLGQAGGERGVQHPLVFHGDLQQTLHRLGRTGFVICGRYLQQHIPGRGIIQRAARAGNVVQYQCHTGVTQHFKRGQAGAQPGLRQGQQLKRLLRARHGHQRHQLRRRQRKQFEYRCGNDAQRALGANVDVAQVVARVVLAQGAQAIPEVALRGDDFQPQAQLARIAVAQHLHATGIAGQVAADGAGALGRQTQRKKTPNLFGGLLHLQQGNAGLDHDGVVERIDGANPVQARQGNHQG